jgi:hypothetical protein
MQPQLKAAKKGHVWWDRMIVYLAADLLLQCHHTKKKSIPMKIKEQNKQHTNAQAHSLTMRGVRGSFVPSE